MKIPSLLPLLAALWLTPGLAADETVALRHATVEVSNQETLQRGARLFMNFCASCHTLRYLRYSTMAQDLGLVNDDGSIAKEILLNNLVFTSAKITDPIQNALPANDAKVWFGVAPPDLTLEAKLRSPDWIYTYLQSFYNAPTRPFGTNNLLYPDVAMPNVLAPLQGEQIAIYKLHHFMFEGKAHQESQIAYLQLVSPGLMTPFEFDSAINDIVTFLVYASEPQSESREALGYWVIGFLLILLVMTYLLKKAYWRHLK